MKMPSDGGFREIVDGEYRATHDPEADAVAVRWPGAAYRLTASLDGDDFSVARNVDLGADGAPIGVEFLNVSRGVDLRGVPRAEKVADLLGRLGVPVAHGPDAPDPRPPLGRALAEALRVYRGQQDLSQEGLARRLGSHQSVVARLEAGKRTPSLDTLARVAAALGLRLVVELGPEEAPTWRLVA
jgi:DNA-binding XRE family transcriptional regulator